MPMLYKMWKTLVTFGYFKVRIPDIPKLSRNAKGYLISQNFWERSDIMKIKIHMWTVWLLTCSWYWTWKKDKGHVPQRNEMLSLYYTALGFISKNEKYNPE